MLPLSPPALSRIYLHAVLPCLSELAESDPAARRILHGLNFVLQIRLGRQACAVLTFRQQKISFSATAMRHPDLELFFFNDAHLNGFFGRKKWLIPWLSRGAWRVRELKAFAKLTTLLEAYLKPNAGQLRDPVFARLFARLTMILLGGGLKPLSDFDPAMKACVDKLPRGLLEFSITSEALSVWFESATPETRAGLGPPPRAPEVKLEFANVEIATRAFRDELDVLAATVLGQIRVTGLLPLADGMNVVMERLRDYLDPKTEP